MSRGGGRGSRGGFSNRNEGPTLPWSLQQQVGGPQTGRLTYVPSKNPQPTFRVLSSAAVAVLP